MKARVWAIIGDRVTAAQAAHKATGEPVDIKQSFDLIDVDLAVDGLKPGKVLARPRFLPAEHNIAHAAEGKPINPAALLHDGVMCPGNGGTLEVIEAAENDYGITTGDIVALQCCGNPDEFGNPQSIFGYDLKGTRGIYADAVEIDAFQLIPLPNVQVSEPVIAAASLRLPTAYSNTRECLNVLGYKRRVGGPLIPSELWALGFGGAVTEVTLLYLKSLGWNVIFCSGTKDRRDEMEARGAHIIDQNAFKRFKGDDDKETRELTKKFRGLVKEMTGGKYCAAVFDYIGGPIFDAAIQACSRNAVIGTAGWQLGPIMPHPRATMCVTRTGYVFSHYASRAEVIESMSLLTPELSPLVDPEPWKFEALPEMIEALHQNKRPDGRELKGVPYVDCLAT